jgi:hypothetical protein
LDWKIRDSFECNFGRFFNDVEMHHKMCCVF